MRLLLANRRPQILYEALTEKHTQKQYKTETELEEIPLSFAFK